MPFFLETRYFFRGLNKNPSVVFSGTHRQNDVSDVDASILIDSATLHYALHYHTSAVG